MCILPLLHFCLLSSRYQHLLTANLINKVSNVVEGSTSQAARTYLAELKAEFHSRTREISKSVVGVTVVKINGGGDDFQTAADRHHRHHPMKNGSVLFPIQAGPEPSHRPASTLVTSLTNPNLFASSSFNPRTYSSSSAKALSHRSMTRLSHNPSTAGLMAAAAPPPSANVDILSTGPEDEQFLVEISMFCRFHHYFAVFRSRSAVDGSVGRGHSSPGESGPVLGPILGLAAPSSASAAASPGFQVHDQTQPVSAKHVRFLGNLR